MTEKEIIRQAMKVRGYTQQMMADSLGLKCQALVADRLSKRCASLKVDTLLQMLDVLGYDVIVQDRNTNGQTWKIELAKEE